MFKAVTPNWVRTSPTCHQALKEPKFMASPLVTSTCISGSSESLCVMRAAQGELKNTFPKLQLYTRHVLHLPLSLKNKSSTDKSSTTNPLLQSSSLKNKTVGISPSPHPLYINFIFIAADQEGEIGDSAPSSAHLLPSRGAFDCPKAVWIRKRAGREGKQRQEQLSLELCHVQQKMHSSWH